LENVKTSCKLHCQEIFGPVCFLEKFTDFKEVCDRVNDSAYGLQAGIFTQNIHKAFYAFQNIHAGGILINEIPSARVDSQPVTFVFLHFDR
jgi:succinate-semialdehyde dehydrogenase/glutarate-semialdehyde dehydrogenase